MLKGAARARLGRSSSCAWYRKQYVKCVEGFKFRGAKECIPQMWFVDDGAFVAVSLATLQLVLDTCWKVTRAAGLKTMIKGIKKTAWQASYWEGDEEKPVDGWQM